MQKHYNIICLKAVPWRNDCCTTKQHHSLYLLAENLLDCLDSAKIKILQSDINDGIEVCHWLLMDSYGSRTERGKGKDERLVRWTWRDFYLFYAWPTVISSSYIYRWMKKSSDHCWKTLIAAAGCIILVYFNIWCYKLKRLRRVVILSTHIKEGLETLTKCIWH